MRFFIRFLFVCLITVPFYFWGFVRYMLWMNAAEISIQLHHKIGVVPIVVALIFGIELIIYTLLTAFDTFMEKQVELSSNNRNS